VADGDGYCASIGADRRVHIWRAAERASAPICGQPTRMSGLTIADTRDPDLDCPLCLDSVYREVTGKARILAS
jgi:hypothetical protein